MKEDLLKAEVLITKRCNLNCSFCKIPKDIKERDELNLEEWKEAFRIVYEDLGASFIAIYGGEPLCLDKDKLLDIIENLSSYREKGKSYTLISNCIGLTNEYMDEMIDKGLDSFTASMDTLDENESLDNISKIKSRKGLNTLLKFKEKGIRDVCGIITATKKNIKNIPQTVKYLSDKGIWVGIDVIHYRKGNTDLPKKSQVEELLLTRGDMPIIIEVADKLIRMKKEGYLIFPTYEVLEGWKNPNYIIDLNWKCGTNHPYCITIDSNGTLMECDSFRGSRIKKYKIFDLPNKWKEFKKDYFDDVCYECLGCFWSTHFCAEDIIKKKGVKYYQHETNKI